MTGTELIGEQSRSFLIMYSKVQIQIDWIHCDKSEANMPTAMSPVFFLFFIISFYMQMKVAGVNIE